MSDIALVVLLVIMAIVACVGMFAISSDVIKRSQDIDEVLVTGPDSLTDYVTKKHPMVIRVKDGKYTITIVEPK